MMTVPPKFKSAARKVSDMVREMFPTLRVSLGKHEAALGIYLRGNKDMLDALEGMIQERIEGRAVLPEPSDPLMCKSMMARDRELRWLMSRFRFVFASLPSDPVEDSGEQPDQ